MGGRGAAWGRWITRPWRSAGLITALIASFALPAFMAASADVFLVSASDSITQQVLEDNPAGLDLTVVAQGRLTASGVDDLDTAMASRLDRVGRLGAPDRIVYADLALQIPAPDLMTSATTIIGSGGRFFARDGAIEALDVIDGDRSVNGVWISERAANRLELGPGSLVSIADSTPLPVAGVFANLWEGERDPYWDDVPPAFVPRFSRVLSGPLFETVILPESVLTDLGVDGFVRWDAAVIDPPDSLTRLSSYTTRTRGIERSYTESTEMATALAAFAGAGGATPTLSTEAFDLFRQLERIVAELDQPIATAAIGGIVLGLIVTAAGAAFAVRKHEAEFRLLSADGDAPWRFAARSLPQFAAPAVAGAALGVGAAWLVIAAPGDGDRSGAIDVWAVAIVAATGLAVAAVVTGWSASQVSQTRRSAIGSIRAAWILPILGIAVAAWVQVGAAGDAGEVDPLVIAFPLVGLVAGVGVIVIASRSLMRRAHRSGGALPPALFLAWRRITSADSSASLLSAAMGISLGLIIFASSLVSGLDTAAAAKATTAIGGPTQARVDGPFEAELPAETTLVRVLSTRTTIGDARVTVLAIDSDTYATGVSWHPTFGSSAADVVTALDQPTEPGETADVTAVVAGRFTAPARAGFGTTIVTSYTTVASIKAAPLASRVAPTLLVDADQLEAAARDAHDDQRPAGVDVNVWAAEFRSPLLRSSRVIISQLDDAALVSFAEDNGIRLGDVVTLSDRRDEAGNRAARWTFEYVRLLAVIAGLAALGTLLFYLTEQRARRQLSTVMAERMGLRRRTAAIAAVGEVLGLVSVALVAGTSTGLVIAHRVFARFEPEPGLAPEVGLEAPWSVVIAVAGAAVVVVVAAALANQWLARRRTYAEVLRGS
ncbi:MAG: hypothetical protein AB8G14_13535 [Ilumatobacter sp.]